MPVLEVPMTKTILLKTGMLAALVVFISCSLNAQTITGAWKGKVKNTRVELKLVRSGDSISGTSYYYESKTNYRRYAVKGYFDPNTNEVIWWDDMLLEDQSSKSARTVNSDALLSVADFNCPGEDEMLLDGSASLRDNSNIEKGNVHLQKTNDPLFSDEWDYVIENFMMGANDPVIINSIAKIAYTKTEPEFEPETRRPVAPPVVELQPGITRNIPVAPVSVETKFAARKKVLATVIPVAIEVDSVELRFYDNAEIDGDSIALFLNNQMIFKHVKLSDQPHTVRLPVNSLLEDNELVMVAENLGSIPPNTSLMIALVGDKRYEARLQSTENSSALIRFIKSSSKPEESK